MSSAQIVSASVLQNTASARIFGTPGIAGNAVPMHTMLSPPAASGIQQAGSPVVVKHEIINPGTGLVSLVNFHNAIRAMVRLGSRYCITMRYGVWKNLGVEIPRTTPSQ